MADVFLHGRIAYGLAFFLVFFLVTTLFLLPLVLLGRLSRTLSLRAVGQWAAVIVGVFYLLAGLKLLIPRESDAIFSRPSFLSSSLARGPRWFRRCGRARCAYWGG